jgi:predicted dehydrogenase
MEGLMYLSHPTIQRFIEIIKSGAIGKVRSVLGQYAAPIASVANPTSGGTILDLGCYPVSLLQLAIQTAFGDAAFEDRRAISATGLTASDGATILDTALSVRFGCGVLASIQSSSTFGFSSTFVVFGDKGSIEFVTNPWLPVAGQNIMRLHHDGDEVEEVVVNATDDAYSCQVHVAEQMIKAGQIVAIRPSPTPNDSIEIMSLLTEWRSLTLASSDLEHFA